jgi:hypothetical protein
MEQERSFQTLFRKARSRPPTDASPVGDCGHIFAKVWVSEKVHQEFLAVDRKVVDRVESCVTHI